MTYKYLTVSIIFNKEVINTYHKNINISLFTFLCEVLKMKHLAQPLENKLIASDFKQVLECIFIRGQKWLCPC